MSQKYNFSPDIAYTPDMSQRYIYKTEKRPICHNVSRARASQSWLGWAHFAHTGMFMNNNLFLMWSSSTESGMLQCTVHKADNWSPVSKGATSDWNHLTASKSKSKADAKITTLLHAMMKKCR